MTGVVVVVVVVEWFISLGEMEFVLLNPPGLPIIIGLDLPINIGRLPIIIGELIALLVEIEDDSGSPWPANSAKQVE